MQISYISIDGIKSFVLPEKISGRYWIKDTDNQNIVSIESAEQKWCLKSNKNNVLLDESGNEIKKIFLQQMSINRVYSKETEQCSFVFAEPITENRATYVKYGVLEDIELVIGKTPDCDIFYNNPFVSKTHAVLSYKNGVWHIEDKESKNGTYVNNYPVNKVLLKPGDVIYIMGMKLIIGDCFFAVNNPDNQVVVNEANVGLFNKPNFDVAVDEYELDKPEYFYRSPRFRREVKTAKIKVDNPPSNQFGEEMPLMLVLGPSITMGLASVTMAVFSINNAITTGNISNAIPSIAMSVSMLLGTMLWPVISKRYDKNRRLKKEEKRQKKYSEYLKEKETQITDEIARQEEILRENSVTIPECVERIDDVSRTLWERTLNHKDLLELRLGTGIKELDAEILYSERRFTLDEDNLNEDMLTLCESPKILKNIPITISLFENYISGAIGNEKELYSFIKGLILQIITFYSKDDVKLVFLYDEKQSEEFEFVKWLPHVWDDEMNYRFIATNDEDGKDLTSYFEQIINNRSEINEAEIKGTTPYYIVFVLDKNLGVGTDFIKKLLSMNKNINISTLFAYRELKELPKECSIVVELSGSDGKLYDKNNISDTVSIFKPDIAVKEDLTEIAKKISNIPLDPNLKAVNLPDTVSFLNIYDVGKVEHLNVLERWQESTPSKSLEAFVGVDTNGKLFKLDLHEKFHGPHGLVAGMTGSGKSEFIITYILSMAVNFHPDEVAFILIDYKGGGMAKSFENLPHTAGIITNLDGSSIKRSLVSIQSELKRRQAIFAKVSKDTGVSNIDIYKYQKLRREGKVKEPLQHLFIIADEFAELKTQQPEFMEQLVSAARIGRSLGIHLILATQKPSGVVDDQIWSNSKFRVCLKVQERSDSMDMLKRPDAAELSQTGRFYLQVGYNELFELGQSAWAGANYYPSDSNVKEKNNSVEVISRTGHIISQAKPANINYGLDTQKQMDAITKYLRFVADEENISVRPLWLPPLEAGRTIDDLINEYSFNKLPFVLNLPIGEYDNPYNQQKGLSTLPLSECGNALVYGIAGSGKTTFLTTMLYSLVSQYTPDEVQAYVLDFASETLKAFEKAPHIGEVMLSDDKEKINRFFDYLLNEIKQRKKLFADFGGDFRSYLAEAETKVPNIVVAVNNYAAFIEQYEELEEVVALITRECTKYGIYFVMTVPNTNTIRYRMMQNFGQIFTMQLSDESEYANVIGKTDGLYPDKFKGRGLFKKDEILEFQTANITNEGNTYKHVKEFCESLGNKYSNNAKRISVIPNNVTIEDLRGHFEVNSNTVPIGFNSEDTAIFNYPLYDRYITLITGNSKNPALFSKAIYDLISDDKTIVLNSESLDDVRELFDLTVKRFQELKSNANATFERKLIFINNIAQLRENLSSDDRDRIDLILQKGSNALGMNIVLTEVCDKLFSIAGELWYKQNIGNNNGIWVGSGFAEQYRINVENRNNRYAKSTESNQGFAIIDGIATPIKLPLAGKEW